MNGKFRTTSSTLFNKDHVSQLPDWMKNVDTDVKEVEKVDLEFDLKGAFAEKITVARNENQGSPRYLEANYNNTRLITGAKVELAKFLSGKYYKVKESVAKNNNAKLNVAIDGLPGEFIFNFNTTDGKIKEASTFNVFLDGENGEYPFSKAGFNECVNDLQRNQLKHSQKTESIGKTFIISREEIIRRFNGKLRPATDKINELLSQGEIIGVDSNRYASFTNVDHLFPQLEREEKMPEKVGEFEFAPNQEHVATNEYKSANTLGIDASKTLSNFFSDYCIRENVRDNNELLVKADILSNKGVTKTVNFSFGIKNEKLSSIKFAEVNDERLTMDQLLEKLNVSSQVLNNYLSNNKTAKRIYRGVVLTHKEIKRRLIGTVKKDNIDKIITNWTERNLVTPINSTTYTTTKSFEDLLDSIKVSTLSEKEKLAIKQYSKKFGSGLESERQSVKDTGVREAEEKVSDETLLSSAGQFLSKYFKNFAINDFNQDGETVNYSVQLFDDDSGVSATINISLQHTGNKVKSAKVDINGRQVGIDKVKEAFAKNEVLNKYLEKTPGKKVKSQIVMSKKQMVEKLKDITNADLNEVEEVINNWEENNKIIKLSSNTFGSDYTFEELISMSNIKPLSDNEIKERIAKSQRDRDKGITSAHIQDQDTRKMVEKWSSDRMLIHAKSNLNQLYKDYDILDVTLKDDSYIVKARVFNPKNEMREAIKVEFAMKDNKPGDVINIDTPNITSEAITEYTQLNKTAQRRYKRVIKRRGLYNKLANVISQEKLSEIEKMLINNNILIPVGSNEFVSEYSYGEIISHLSRFNYTDVQAGKNQRKLAKRNDDNVQLADKRIMNNDTRKIESKEKSLSPQLIKLKDKIKVTASKAHSNKVITKNKLNQLENMLNFAKSHHDLEIVWKELKKYFK